MQTTWAPVVLEEETFLGLQGGVQAGAGAVRTLLLSGPLTPWCGQDDSGSRQVGAALFFQASPPGGSLPPLAPSWPLTGAAKQCPGMERPGTHSQGLGDSGRGSRAGCGICWRTCACSASSPVGWPLSCLRLPFPHQPSPAHFRAFQSLPQWVGPPWSSRHRAGRAHPDTSSPGVGSLSPSLSPLEGPRGLSTVSHLLCSSCGGQGTLWKQGFLPIGRGLLLGRKSGRLHLRLT